MWLQFDVPEIYCSKSHPVKKILKCFLEEALLVWLMINTHGFKKSMNQNISVHYIVLGPWVFQIKPPLGNSPPHLGGMYGYHLNTY